MLSGFGDCQSFDVEAFMYRSSCRANAGLVQFDGFHNPTYQQSKITSVRGLVKLGFEFNRLAIWAL